MNPTAEPSPSTSLMRLPAQLIEDALYCFSRFPRACVAHLRDNVHRLVRGRYRTSDDRGCVFGILSELLPAAERISDRESLTRHFTGGHGETHREQERYQPARYLVRAWDGENDPGTVLRYGWCGQRRMTVEDVRDLAGLYLSRAGKDDQAGSSGEDAEAPPLVRRVSTLASLLAKVCLAVALVIGGVACQSGPKITKDPQTGAELVDMGTSVMKKYGLLYQKYTNGSTTLENLVMDGDETVVPVKAADVYQTTELAELALEGLKATTANPNKIPKDPNKVPVDPHKPVPPGNPNYVAPPPVPVTEAPGVVPPPGG
jgi:hypothetical protein